MARFEVWDGTRYVAIPGTPGPQTFAQVGAAPPTARAVGDIWVDTGTPLLEWDDDWQYPVLMNGWVDYNPGTYGSVRYRKTPGGLVLVEGMIKGGVVGDTAKPVFILPETHRPGGITTVAGANVNQNPCRILINQNPGYFQIHVGDPYWVSIHCSFLAAS